MKPERTAIIVLMTVNVIFLVANNVYYTFSTTKSNYIWVLIVSVVSSGVIFLNSERFIRPIVRFIARHRPKNPNQNIEGRWNIWIDFTDEATGKVTGRDGTLKISRGLFGYEAEGAPLYDRDPPKRQTMESWECRNFEYVNTDNGEEVVSYLYETIEADKKGAKRGLVILTRDASSGHFKGPFLDISISGSDEVRRSGQVTLANANSDK